MENKGLREDIELSNLPDDPRTFYDTLMLLHQPYDYKSFLYDKDLRQSNLQELLDLNPLFDVEKYGGVVCIYEDCVIKSRGELEKQLNDLIAILRNYTKSDSIEIPVNYLLLLSSSCHVFGLKIQNGALSFKLFDINQFPSFEIPHSRLIFEISIPLILEKATNNSILELLHFFRAFIEDSYIGLNMAIVTLRANPHLADVAARLNEYKCTNPVKEEYAQRKTKYGTTLAYLAANFGHHDVLESLGTFKNADFYSLSPRGGSPLQAACINGHVKAVITLLKYVDPRTCKLDRSLLSDAQNLDVVEVILKDGRDDINHAGSQFAAPLLSAADEGNLPKMKLLLQYGADVSVQYQGCNALSLAVENNCAEMIHLLAKYKMKLDSKIDGEHSAIAISIKYGKLAAFKALFESGAECIFYKSSTAEQNVAHYASYFGRIEIIRYLIEKNFDMTAMVPALHKTALTFAIEEKEWAIAARILMSLDTMTVITDHDKALIQDNLNNIYQAYSEERKYLPKELPLNVMHLTILMPAYTQKFTFTN